MLMVCADVKVGYVWLRLCWGGEGGMLVAGAYVRVGCVS